ncbi:M15 family metallopeptidase [Georgenia alba]|uniref:M15 family metallopeptidase n=1 Tax=Georgenia alba TaxID=2233858 RepID=A0ABW2QBC6_9MICO
MTRTTAAGRTHRGTLSPLAAGLVVVAILGGLVLQSVTASSSGDARVDPTSDGTVTEADGVLPDGATAFDEQYPGVANLGADLLRALQDASTDAADEGVVIVANSGWRSAEYQDQLLRETVSAYGSEAEAARWVATAETSSHVSGDAVDVGGQAATVWLAEHGAAYGLCPVYANEPWHYELRPEAVGRRCPPTYADPTDDPRMQQ